MSENHYIKIQTALISSWEKEPAVKLAETLDKLGVDIWASGGTAKAIRSNSIAVRRLEDLTGFDQLLDGRVKTLHPVIYAALLARRENTRDLEQLSDFGVKPFDLAAVDLYPFQIQESAVAIPVELIDIGGVSLIRAAAKNYADMMVLHTAGQFEKWGKRLRDRDCKVSLTERRKLAGEAFRFVAEYDGRIAETYLSG